MEVLEFRLGRDEYLRVKSPIISKNCSGRETSRGVNITGSPFYFSESMNKFIAAGCNNEAFMTGIEPTIVGCESACIGNRLFGPNPNATCDGSTCCETVIPSRLHVFNATFQSKESESEGCKLAFLVEEEWFYNNITDKSSAFQNVDYVPALLDWAIPDEAFELPTKRGRDYYCNGYRYMDTEPYYLNSSRCYCYGGYEGNAYLPNGCQGEKFCSLQNDAAFILMNAWTALTRDVGMRLVSTDQGIMNEFESSRRH
ncbi:hypothetical protein SCA6_015889 [Theobroma cacao]